MRSPQLSQDANCPIVAFIKVVAGDANRPSNKMTGMGMMMAMMVPGGKLWAEVVKLSNPPCMICPEQTGLLADFGNVIEEEGYDAKENCLG